MHRLQTDIVLRFHSHLSVCKANERDSLSAVSFVLALPIFPVRLQTSIFGAGELNFRVRDGNGWTLTAINTNLLFPSGKSIQLYGPLPEPGDPYGNRTHVCGVRGRRLNRLTNGPLVHLQGLEPWTP